MPVGDEPFEQLMEAFVARRNGAALQLAMDGLTEGVADAVRFRVIDGLAYADIATRLLLVSSLGTAR